MRGGVSGRGAVAATHMTTGLTHAEMDRISPTCGDAVLASRRGGIGILDLINVGAHRLAHVSLHTCPSGTEPGRGLVVGRVQGGVDHPYRKAHRIDRCRWFGRLARRSLPDDRE